MSDNQHPTRLLIGSQRPPLGRILDCTAATTITAWSQTHRAEVVLASTCEAWSCRCCGEHKAKRLARIAQAAKPNRLITLTVNPTLHDSPRAAFDNTRRQLGPFTRTCRKLLGSMEYLRVLEITKRGWPHYHLVARCPYLPHQLASDTWNALTGAPIVDVRQIKQSKDVYWYVVKYLSKQGYIDWTERRVTMTKNFATADTTKPPDELGLIDFRSVRIHPAEYLRYEKPRTAWIPLSHKAWLYDGRLSDTRPQEPVCQEEQPASGCSS